MAIKPFRSLPKDIRTLIERDSESGCWLWRGSYSTTGYGQITYHTVKWRVHRLVYTKLVGPISDRLVMDHLCNNRGCCNPEHLEAVTSAENFKRGKLGAYLRVSNG